MPKERSVVQNILTVAVFILLEVAAVLMLSHNNQIQRLWIARISHGFMAKVWGTTQGVSNYFSLKRQNDELAVENNRLQELVRGYKVYMQGAVCFKTHINPRYIENHQGKAAESACLLCNLNKSVLPQVFKPVSAPDRKSNIRYHNNCNHYKSVYINPFHNLLFVSVIVLVKKVLYIVKKILKILKITLHKIIQYRLFELIF